MLEVMLSRSSDQDGNVNLPNLEQQLNESMASLVMQATDSGPRLGQTLMPQPDEDHQNIEAEEKVNKPSSNSLTPKEEVYNDNDDLIPSSDPCYRNLKLRSRSVELLQLVTARTILGFVLSLLEGEEFLVGGGGGDSNDSDSLIRSTVIPSPTRQSIIRSVERNQDSFARHSRSETQIIIGQCLFNTRAKILDEYEENINNNHQKETEEDELEKEEEERLGRRIEEGLNEANVSRLVDEELSRIISKDFTNYSYKLKLAHHPSSLTDSTTTASSSPPSSVNLLDLTHLISFSGKVFYWNKFFNLILPTHV